MVMSARGLPIEDHARAIVQGVASLTDPDARKRAVEVLTAGNPELLRRVQQLLREPPATQSMHISADGNPDLPPRPVGGAATHIDSAPAPQRAHPELGKAVGRYHLVELIGEGGMGQIYRAHPHNLTEPPVAIKFMRPAVDTRNMVLRFQAESDALRRLEHPGIARFLDAGVTDDGVPYYVMELIRGDSLDKFLRRHSLSVQARLELFTLICDAVEHAHQRGVIHRDLKPSNILVTRSQGHLQPKIIDFGIAHLTTPSAHSADQGPRTGFRQILGTPSFMSPEQIDISFGDIDVRTDVYALGCILYKMLCGQSVFDPRRLEQLTPAQLSTIICQQAPVRPSMAVQQLELPRQHQIETRFALSVKQLRQTLRHDLDWIVLKALAKDKTDRYQSVRELREDIQQYLQQRPVSARPPSQMYVLGKLIRRNRGLFAMAVALLLALVGGMLATVHFATSALRARRLAEVRLRMATNAGRQAERARLREQEQAYHASQLLYDADMKLASDAWRAGDISRVDMLLKKHEYQATEHDFRDFSWHYLRQRLAVVPQWEMQPLSDNVGKVFWHERANRLVLLVGDTRVVVARFEGGDVHTESMWQLPGPANTIAFSTQGSLLAAGMTDGAVLIWPAEVLWDTGGNDASAVRDLPPWKQSLPPDIDEINSLHFTPDDARLFVAGDSGILRRWDWADGRVDIAYPPRQRAIEQIDVSPDGKWVATACSNATLTVWDSQEARQHAQWTPPDSQRVVTVGFSSDSRFVVGGDIRGRLGLIELATGKATTAEGLDGIESVVFLPQASPYLFTGDRGGAVRGWSIVRDEREQRWQLQRDEQVLWQAAAGRISSLAVLHAQQLISGSRDGYVKSWDLSPRVPYREYPAASQMAVGADGTLLLGDRHLDVYDLCRHERLRRLAPSTTGYTHMAVASQRPYVLVRDAERFVLFDYAQGRELFRLDDPREPWAIAVSADGQQIAMADREERRFVELIDCTTGRRLLLPAVQCSSLAFSDNNRYLAYNELDDVVIYDLQLQRATARLVGHDTTVTGIAFSPNSSDVVTVSDDRRLKVWDPHHGTLRYSTEAHQREVKRVHYSQFGRFILTSGHDEMVRLWGASSLHPTHEIRMPTFISDIGFSTKCQRLVVLLKTGEVRVYSGASTTSPTSP
ncbi:MAG: serine/threonine protein kinase [Pirellulaceae bacterium]|nr:MAG: serine/threonine protein kinase [Pirellulaceae bacterium]